MNGRFLGMLEELLLTGEVGDFLISDDNTTLYVVAEDGLKYFVANPGHWERFTHNQIKSFVRFLV